MAKINQDWLQVDTDAYSIMVEGTHSGVIIPAVIEFTELEVTKRVQFLPQHLVDDDIELDNDGYYKSIVLRQFATYFALSRIMLSFRGAGGSEAGDVYGTKYMDYMKIANGLLPEITGDTANNDGSEVVEETNGSYYFMR